MTEQLLSPGREEYPEEIQRPSGRSFLSEEKGTNGQDTLPDAQQFIPDPNKKEWFADYCRWRFGRDASSAIITHVGTRVELKNELL